MYEELIMRLLEDKSWIEQGTTETEHEIADHLQKAVNAIEELSKERKTGKWIYDSEPYPLGNPYGHYGCDQCGESVPARTNFCPNCGVKMEG